jgi:hypothetical protein
MGIITEKIDGAKIFVEINSSNLLSATYNTESKILSINFKNNSIYEYEKVPWDVFTKFRMTESQGKFFTTNIKNSYTFKRVK